MNCRIFLKIENHVVEICKLSVIENNLVGLTRVASVLKANESAAHRNVLLSMQRHDHD